MSEKIAGGSMPVYNVQFTTPSLINTLGAQVILRYYSPWGDGSINGWQQPVTPPVITIDSEEQSFIQLFSYDASYEYGYNGYGYDQHAQYLIYEINYMQPEGSVVSIRGEFQKAAYFDISFAILFDEGNQTQFVILDKDLNVEQGASNPYIEGNASVFSYDNTINSPLKLVDSKNTNVVDSPSMTTKMYNTKINNSSEKIACYKYDRQTTAVQYLDDISSNGCSDAYLFFNGVNESPNYPNGILRMKLPSTFIHNDEPDLIFGSYNCQEFTIGSHQAVTNDLDFWSVNSRMLNEYKDADGYCYVFFTSPEEVSRLIIAQSTPPTIPPVVTWGLYTGYVLAYPTFELILRYRDPDPAWIGSPVNLPCYATPSENQPVADGALGEFTPVLFMDSSTEFLGDKIGPVIKNCPWPNDGDI
ncbi:hypothetical protein ACLEX4_21000 [Pseudescherichia vulneris]